MSSVSEGKANLNAFFKKIINNAAIDYSNREIQDIQGAVVEKMNILKDRINERGLFKVSRIQPCGSMTEKNISLEDRCEGHLYYTAERGHERRDVY